MGQPWEPTVVPNREAKPGSVIVPTRATAGGVPGVETAADLGLEMPAAGGVREFGARLPVNPEGLAVGCCDQAL